MLQLRVTGRDIRPGRIPIPDLLVVCEQAQSAVNRQAEALEGQRTLRPGPITEKVRLECTLELVSLGRGSAVLGFERAKPQPVLPEMAGLGIDAIAGVALAIDSLAKDRDANVDSGVLISLNKMGALLHNGVEAIEWIVPAQHGHRKIKAKFTRQVHERVAAKLKPPKTCDFAGDGVLEMADFKPSDQRCRIHPAIGSPISCTFDSALADEIYSVLRQAAHIEGQATVNAETDRIESVHITRVTALDPLSVNAGNFLRGWSLEQLVRMQAVTPLNDVRELAGVWPAEDDIDAALKEIYDHRD